MLEPEDQWSCKRSPDIWAYCKYKTSKIGQGQPRVIIYIKFVELDETVPYTPQCYMPSFKIIGLLVLEKKIFKGFHHNIWAWWPCDLDHLYKLSFLLPKPRRHVKFGLDWLLVKIMVMYMYIAPGRGRQPLRSIFNSIIQSI